MAVAAESIPTEGTIGLKGGTTLFFRRWLVEQPRARVAFVHGYAEHIGRYEYVAAALNGAGIDVTGIDLRGHGRSAGPRGYVHRYSDYHDDVDTLTTLVKERSEGADRPWFLLGHSNGGLVVLSYALERQADCRGVIATAPFLGPAMKVPPAKLALGRIMSYLYPKYSESNGIDVANLSHNPEIGRAYAEDPLVFSTANARWFTEAIRTAESLRENAMRFRSPCFVLQGSDDRLADPKLAKPLVEAFASEDKRYLEYSGFYHEILNEVERDRVISDIVNWIKARS